MFNLHEELRRRSLLCDGAMGTELIARGVVRNEFADHCSVRNEEAVLMIHRAYVDAGCDCITTNTFGGLHVREGVKIAKMAAEDSRCVLGSIGPVGEFERCACELHESGCDAIIIETMSEVEMMKSAISAVKNVAEWPVIVCFVFRQVGDDFRTSEGVSPEDAMRVAMNAGADVVGTNCGIGIDLDGYARLAERIVRVSKDVPTIVQPNAGNAREIRGKFEYAVSPQEMANLVPRLLSAGVRMIGGCCGTSPAHQRAMRMAMGERWQRI